MTGLCLKVLVADDCSTVRRFFADVAAQSPIPFVTIDATNGRQCLDHLDQGGVNLAFIDINMPELSGMDAVSLSREHGHSVFTTLMSANANMRRMQLARQLKVYEFLPKPFAAADIHAILRTYCRVTAPIRVLVVDDSATVRRLIGRVLRASVFNTSVTEAADGREALAAWQGRGFDVVFLDCNMPGLDGIQTLERMVAQHPEVRVVMISGARDPERHRQALARGACDFLYKPFFAEDVDRVLHDLYGLKSPGLAAIAPMKLAAPSVAIA